MVLGLLSAPFTVLTNTEVLSESVSLSVACMLVASTCPLNASRKRQFGNVVGVLACLALLAMARTAHLPVVLGASGATALMLFSSVERRRLSRRERALRLMMIGAGIAAWIAVVVPQACEMWKHE